MFCSGGIFSAVSDPCRRDPSTKKKPRSVLRQRFDQVNAFPSGLEVSALTRSFRPTGAS